MSKLARKPAIIPDGVTVKLNGRQIEVGGKNGALSLKLLDYINLELSGNRAVFKLGQNNKQARANWATVVALFKNALKGVTEGFFKILELEGIGYRATMEGTTLNLNVGFTHPVKYISPEGIKLSIEKNAIKIFGADRQLVGQTAAEIRKIKKPEPYKGKGIHYRGEVVRRKAGKKVVGTTAGA